MSANIYASAYTIYSGTPGAGDWLVDCRLSSINTAVGTLTWTATVNGITVGGAAEVRGKDAGQTTAQAVVPIHCAAGEAVTVTVQSSNSGDTAVTASSTVAPVAANATQIKGVDADAAIAAGVDASATAGVLAGIAADYADKTTLDAMATKVTAIDTLTKAGGGGDLAAMKAVTDDLASMIEDAP